MGQAVLRAIGTSASVHEVYFSYDLAIHFLREYDRRNSTGLANQYIDKVFRQAQLPTLYLNLKLHV